MSKLVKEIHACINDIGCAQTIFMFIGIGFAFGFGIMCAVSLFS